MTIQNQYELESLIESANKNDMKLKLWKQDDNAIKLMDKNISK